MGEAVDQVTTVEADTGGNLPEIKPTVIDGVIDTRYRSIIGSLQKLGWIEDSGSVTGEPYFRITRKYHGQVDGVLARQKQKETGNTPAFPLDSPNVRLGFNNKAGRRMFEVEWAETGGKRTRVALVPTDRKSAQVSLGKPVYEVEVTEPSKDREYRFVKEGKILTDPADAHSKRQAIPPSTWGRDKETFRSIDDSLQTAARQAK